MLPPLLQVFLNFKGLLVAGAITLFGTLNFMSLTAKAKWPQIDAVVVKSFSQSQAGDPQKAQLDFSYRYTVAGQRITSSSVFASTFRQEVKYAGEVSAIVARFPVGTEVVAFVNPDDSHEAYIDLTPGVIDYALPAAGAFGLLCFSVYQVTQRKKKTSL